MELVKRSNSMDMKMMKTMPRNNMTMLLIIEVVCCVILIMLSFSWPPTVLIMAEMYLRELSVMFRFSTHSVFIIGNLIIILVVVQSGKMSNDVVSVTTTPTTEIDSCRVHYVIESRRQVVDDDVRKLSVKEPKREKETQSCPVTLIEPISSTPMKINAVAEKVKVMPESSQIYRRTMSARYERGGGGGGVGASRRATAARPELRRSKTVKRVDCDVKTTTFDDLNHEEFRRKIETFIAKQRRLIREELREGDGFRKM